MSFYIFVISDSYDLDENRVRSPVLYSYRLEKKVYPLYYRTRLKKNLKSNDSFIFYLAGTPPLETKKFAAYGKIKEIKKDKNYNEDLIHISQPIEKIVVLESVVTKKPLCIYKVKDKLSFITKKKKWGPSMQGGIIKITEEDYDLIVKEMNE
ncbi:hypothetical protein N8209_02555 [Gammaproteobacteria bacterium]|nr:hypothetical protein [Gammaproteobacteria bacterium]